MSIPFPAYNVTSSLPCVQMFGVDYHKNVGLRMANEGMHLLVFIIAIVQYIRIQSKDPAKSLTPQKFFHILIALVSAVQLAFIPLPYQVLDQITIFAAFIIQALPGVLYFSAYLLLFFYWAAVYHRAVQLYSNRFQHSVLLWFLGINLVAYSFMVALAAWSYTHSYSYTRMTKLSGVFTGFLSLSITLFAALYGLLSYWRLRQFPVVSWASRSVMRKVGAVTVICCCTFVIRAVLVVYINTHLCGSDISYEDYELVWFFFLFAADVAPALLVLFLIRVPPTAAHRRVATKLSSTDYATKHDATLLDSPQSARDSPAQPLRTGADSTYHTAPDSSARFTEIDPLYLTFFGSGAVEADPADGADRLLFEADDDETERLHPHGAVNSQPSGPDPRAGDASKIAFVL